MNDQSAAIESQIVQIHASGWQLRNVCNEWINALEAGKVLYFPNLEFALLEREQQLLSPEVMSAETRSITLSSRGLLKGVQEDGACREATREMIGRFRQQSMELIRSLVPAYTSMLQPGTTSYRPLQVETRKQSWRADDRRLHVDAFAGKPNHGKRILRVFTNIHPTGVPRVWRVGEPFETVARRFLPYIKPYSRVEAWWLRAAFKTKPIRSEYDHLMLQLHDCMKLDHEYQQTAAQVTVPFPAGSTWVCFSDQVSHAAMSGQYLLEQTFNLPVSALYRTESSPLAILSRLTGRRLV